MDLQAVYWVGGVAEGALVLVDRGHFEFSLWRYGWFL